MAIQKGPIGGTVEVSELSAGAPSWNSAGETVLASASTGNTLRITNTGTGNALVVEDSGNPDSSPFVINSSGNIVAGYTSTVAANAVTPKLQIHGGSSSTGSVGSYYWANNSAAGQFQFNKGRSGTFGTFGIVSSGDTLGSVVFDGDDGAAFIPAASISAFVDGTPSTNDMPGRLTFSTTADGASSPTERMRIDSTGLVTLASGQIKFPASQNASSDANTLDDYEEGTWTPAVNSGAGSITSYTSSGTYTKIGNTVLIDVVFQITNAGTAGGSVTVTGLPFISRFVLGSEFTAPVRENYNTGIWYFGYNGGGTASVTILTSSNGPVSWITNNRYTFSLTYQTPT